MMNRKGLFFTIDAIIALIVLGVGITVLFLAFTNPPQQQQTALYTSDLMSFFRATRVQDVQEKWLINMWCTQGAKCTAPTYNLSRGDQTLLSTFGQLIREGNLPLAAYIATRLSQGFVQQQFSWNLTMVAGNNTYLLVDYSKNRTAEQLLAEKSLVYFVENHTLEGPYVAQVNVWQ
jgi:hypothetical protein